LPDFLSNIKGLPKFSSKAPRKTQTPCIAFLNRVYQKVPYARFLQIFAFLDRNYNERILCFLIRQHIRKVLLLIYRTPYSK